jgi:hypothetical protein
VLRSWHRRLERRRREKPKVGRSPFAQRYHTHTFWLRRTSLFWSCACLCDVSVCVCVCARSSS